MIKYLRVSHRYLQHLHNRTFARSAAVASESSLNSLDTWTEEEQMLRETGESYSGRRVKSSKLFCS